MKIRSWPAPIWRSEHSLPLLGYTLLALLTTWPVILHLGRRIAGGSDAWQFAWNLWWWRYALLNFIHPLCNDFIYTPVTFCNFLHPWSFLLTLAAMPLQGFMPLIAVYNVLALASFVLAGWGMFRLARFLGLGRAAAWLAGLAFSFSPIHFARLSLGHLNLLSYQWLPFFILAVLRGRQCGWTRRSVLAAAGWLLAVALTSWYLLIFSLLWLAILLIVDLVRRPDGRVRHAGALLVIVGLALLPLSPLLVGMARAGTSLPSADGLSTFDVADATAFFWPGEGAFMSRAVTGGSPARVPENFIPWIVLLLAIWGWRGIRREHRGWLGGTLACFGLLSLGPWLVLDGTVVSSLPLPFAWLQQLPGMTLLRAPVRFHIMTALAIGLLFAAGADPWLERSRQGLKTALISAILLLECLAVPIPTAQKSVSPFYEGIAGHPGTGGALIDLHYYADALYFQTIHHHKIMGRPHMIAREPATVRHFLDQTPVIRRLIAENDYAHTAVGWPQQILQETRLPPESRGVTIVAMGYLTGAGELHVVTPRPHELWLDDVRTSAPIARESVIRLDGRRHLIRLRTRSEGPADPAIRLELSGEPLPIPSPDRLRVEPYLPMAGATNGFFCVVYPNVSAAALPPAETNAFLHSLGFAWVVVPFYGNDHYLRDVLGWTPAYEDQWLAAWRLGDTRPSTPAK